MSSKIQIARLSVLSNSFLITIKLAAGVISGSVSIISEAIHSAMDLIASLIALFSVKVSDNPPDSRHPYGHGKMENVSGVIEGMLILAAAVWIIAESVKKMAGSNMVVESLGLGSLVMLVSAIINSIVSGKLYRVAKATGSVALEADALHLKTDVYTSLGVAAGLGLIILTGIHWFDPLIAICIALLIIREAVILIKKAFRPLLDEAWPDDEIKKLEMMLNSMDVNYHDLRTRISGNYRFIDFHIGIPKDKSVEDAHTYCDSIEETLKSKFDKLNITIHVEPEP
ncbi:MAG TPA: cation diffusion facilitator family transporter [Bacteroidales bacterium]|jgi:cation diffusion facilitator family transporter|nr:cation diffusion facilitator family transporter [Bacteroidales bacterium]